MGAVREEPEVRPSHVSELAPEAVEFRFGITTLVADIAAATITMAMPMADLLSPFSGQLTVGPLAILIDDVGGMVNAYLREPHEWPVTSELALELVPDAAAIIRDDPGVPVMANGFPQGPKGRSALAMCTISHGETMIGCGTVRSFYVPMPAEMPELAAGTLTRTPATTLAELLAVQPLPTSDGAHMLTQLTDPLLVNAVGSLHGGVAAAGLELVASAAVNDGRAATPLHTSSIRVNFLRPFIAGGTSHYVGTAVRIGRQTAVADAKAIGDDGKVCLIARVAAYR